ncbi:MAG TPA: arginine N-succinyltransferase, partial [Bdellovibrionota bacterium]|nr:arginine N-succinyltransferase [Bdellovibrionota bacterium]
AENLEDHHVCGTSSVIAQHGTPHAPHFYFEITKTEKYSETLHIGMIHEILRLKTDEHGPTEIGGLVVEPAYRNVPEKLGKQLSFIRLLYIGSHRETFQDRIVAELQPPLTRDGKSLFWEALGRKFVNLDYREADMLSKKNKEFILALFPREDIYISLLAAEARGIIGRIGEQTKPVKHMLENIGFRYLNQIDPFDGGPHFGVLTDEVVPIKKTKRFTAIRGQLQADSPVGLVAVEKPNTLFRAVQGNFSIFEQEVVLEQTIFDTLKIENGEPVIIVPIQEK